MTISTENIRNDYPGNGFATTFPYTFRIFDKTDLRVMQTVVATGVSTLKVLDVDYTVTDVGEDSGNVIMTVAPPDFQTLSILPTIALTQTTDLVNESGFFQERIEGRMDRLCRADQILNEKLGRTLTLPENEAGSPSLVTLPALAIRKGKTLIFDASTGAPGVGALSADHETLGNLQGGTTGQHVHLTNAEYASLLLAISALYMFGVSTLLAPRINFENVTITQMSMTLTLLANSTVP